MKTIVINEGVSSRLSDTEERISWKTEQWEPLLLLNRRKNEKK